MKEFKENYSNYCFLKDRKKYYKNNDNYHGIFILLSNPSKYYLYKGYFNMDEEYGHWIEYNKYFKYYL